MSPSPAVPTFTLKQGQYLAFIYAYTRVLGRPPAEADLQRYSVSGRPPSTKWCSPSSEQGLSDGSPGWRAASKSSLLPNCSQSYADQMSTIQRPPAAGA